MNPKQIKSQIRRISQDISSIGKKELFYRLKHEGYKKLGILERIYTSKELSDRDFIQRLNPNLLEVGSFSEKNGNLAKNLGGYFRNRKTVQFFFDATNFETYNNILNTRFKTDRQKVIQAADKICNHTFNCLKVEEIHFNEQINWHYAFGDEPEWPRIHWSKLNIASSEKWGDVRQTWEFNRHQHFLTLGRAYWYTRDEKYAREFCHQIRSWIEENRAEIGVNWSNNLELAIRSITWILALNFFKGTSQLNDELYCQIIKTIYHTGRHIDKYIEHTRRCMKGNHLIGEAAALTFIGMNFPEFKESQAWIEKGLGILFAEIDEEIYADGVNFEGSISYHRFVLDFYLLIALFCRLNDYTVPQKVWYKLERMIDFIQSVMKPDGSIPMIGDSDDAKVPLLSSDEIADYRSTLSTGAVLFERLDFKQRAGNLSEETLWLCGLEGVETFDSLKEHSPAQVGVPVCATKTEQSASTAFKEGGYYIMRSGYDKESNQTFSFKKKKFDQKETLRNFKGNYLLCKCGPFIKGHNHADLLHIVVSSGGEHFLLGSGTYTYNGEKRWRDFFRSTQAHNTIAVDGESQRIPHRIFKWLGKASPQVRSWIATEKYDYLWAEHDGYTRLNPPVIHRRAILFAKPVYWLLIDELVGMGEHQIESFFHCPPKCQYQLDGKIFTLLNGNMETFRILPLFIGGFDATIQEGMEEPIQGWYSPRYGVKFPSPTLIYRGKVNLPAWMIFLLLPLQQPNFDFRCAELIEKFESGEGRINVSVDCGFYVDYINFESMKQPKFIRNFKKHLATKS